MKKYGIEFASKMLKAWKQRVWYVTRKARDLAFAKATAHPELLENDMFSIPVKKIAKLQ